MKLHIDRPNPRQAEFLAATEKYIAFGGARGGGKSWAVRTKAKLLALRYGGIRLLILRRTYQELESNHIRFLRRELIRLADIIGFHNVPHEDNGAFHGSRHSVSSSVKFSPSDTKNAPVSPSVTMSGSETTRSPTDSSSLATLV